MPDDLEVDLGAVRQAHAIDGDGEDAAFVDRAGRSTAGGAMPSSLLKAAAGIAPYMKTAPSPRREEGRGEASDGSVEGVAEAEHHHVDVGDAGVGLVAAA